MKSFGSFVVFALLVGSAAAQEQTGVLQGRVTDASGSVLPGVTVTVTGPTILGGSKVAVTTEAGLYRIPNIPIGSYDVKFELSSFATKLFEGIRVQADVTFTLEAQLSVAAVQETVTVAGQAPIIDTGDTKVAFTFSQDLMNTVPNARDPWAMMSQAPGVVTSSINVGGTQTGNQPSFTGHGADARQATYLLNGANVTDNTNNGGSQFYFDVDSFDEMQVEINSHSAEIQTPGILLNIVPKSGTNNLHGTGSGYFGNDAIQSNNVTDSLRALGVNRASNLHKYLDTGFDLGGPLVHDRVFFWGAYRYQEVQNFITGTVNPDGSFPIDRTYLWYPSGKVNWQVTPQHNFSTYFNMAQKKRFDRGLSALMPVDTTTNQQGAPIARLFTFRDDWVPGSRLLISLKANIMDQGFELKAQPGVATATTPARMDIATGVWSSAPPTEFGIGKNLRDFGGTANYSGLALLGGQNDIKIGAEIATYRAFGNQGGGVAQTTYPADHRLLFNNGQPFEVIEYASGAQSVVNPTRSAFIQDAWHRGGITLNLGLRWDRQANSLAAVTAPTSRFFPQPVQQQATGNLITWNTLSPRVGVIYDLTGNAKTLLKASYSRYVWQLWTDKGSQASTAGDRSITYLWNDLNGDKLFEPGETGAVVAVTDPAAHPVAIDPNLAPTKTDEVTGALTRELMPNVSLSATFMYRKDRDLTWLINPAISPADYTQVTGIDPGPDGKVGTADDGGPITFYELAKARVALSPNFLTTWPGFEQEYRGFEIQLYRRLVNHWQVVGSLTVGQQRELYGPGSYQSPQDIDKINGTRVANSLPYIAKVEGSYALPAGFTLAAFYQYLSGTHFNRTVNAVAALGRSLNQGNVVALIGQRYGNSYDPLNLLDLRLSYAPPVSHGRLTLNLDGFNMLNINTITSQQTLSGAAFGTVLNFIPPRMLRFGASFRF
jgi:hypothetical protein